MKLIINADRIAATATDAYAGPDAFIQAPPGFDIDRMNDYRLIDGELIIPVPTVVSMRQARLALLNAGLLNAVEQFVETAGAAAKIEWEYAQEIRRDHALVQALLASELIDGAGLDALFIAASGL